MVNVKDPAFQGVNLPEQGDDTKPGTSPNSVPEDSLLAPTIDEVDSVVQPGHRVFDCQLPAELPGSLKSLEGNRDRGQFSDVFLGVWEQPGVPPVEVAIKCIRRNSDIDEKRFNTRIRRETVIWKAAKHPNILQFIGYQICEGRPWLVSPWCQLGNLSRYIAKTPTIKRVEKLNLLCDAARGLRHLHSLTPLIVHGDIKPENVIVKDNLEACLCDFGISRVFLGFNEATTLTTTTNMNGGSAGYQAKEVLEDGTPTTASDVYAFGGLILAAMSGEGPFWKREKECAKIVAVINEETPKPEDHYKLPKTDSLWLLLERCWRVDPGARPSIDMVLQELETEMEGR